MLKPRAWVAGTHIFVLLPLPSRVKNVGMLDWKWNGASSLGIITWDGIIPIHVFLTAANSYPKSHLLKEVMECDSYF